MDFNALIQSSLNLLTRPSETSFESELVNPNATLTNGLLLVVIAGAVAAVLGWLRFTMFGAVTGISDLIEQLDLPPEVALQIESLTSGGALAGIMGASSLGSVVATPILFLIFTGIVHIVAGIVGGQGSFGKLVFLRGAFEAPIVIVGAVLAFVPILGSCLSALLTIYSLILTYFAVKVTYQLTSGRAILVTLVPVAIILVLIICSAVLITMAIVSQL